MKKRGASPARVALVVDDDENIRHLWRVCLTFAGFRVTEAVNGADAVIKALHSPPDVIVIDFNMPVMNGADAVHALKQHASTATTAVIGVTAQALDAATRDFRRVCDAVLMKPVSPDTLLRVLRRVLQRHLPPLPQAAS